MGHGTTFHDKVAAKARPARNQQLIRILQMVDRLKEQRCLLHELSKEFGVSTRTIRRDLEALSIAGIPVRNTADEAATINGFWWVER